MYVMSVIELDLVTEYCLEVCETTSFSPMNPGVHWHR